MGLQHAIGSPVPPTKALVGGIFVSIQQIFLLIENPLNVFSLSWKFWTSTAKTTIKSLGTIVRNNPDANLGNMANNKRAAQRQQRETSSVKAVDSTPTPSVSLDEHVDPATENPSDEQVVPLAAHIETYTSLRDKLIQRMRDEITAAEEKLAELNQQFSSLFPDLASDDQPAPKPKKPKPKPSTKSETSSSEEPLTSAE